MADLRVLFSSNDRFEVDEAFTNRQRQWAVVAAALEEHLQRIKDAAFDVEDLEAPRTNVTVFHGVGGVGKSTLLRKLEAALTAAEDRPAHWGAPAWTERLLPIRIDLARSASTGGSDFERVILTIRLALAGALGRPLTSFDLALRQYWEHTHPGEPLEEYVRRTGLMGRLSTVLPQQTQAAVSEVAHALQLPGVVGSAAGKVTAALVKALRERHERARALAGASRTASLLEATPDLEALSYYPHLLEWELSRLPPKKTATPIVLLDTFEDTADRHRDFERLLQRLVWLMPNTLFIISGRSRLSWADPALHGELDWTGPIAWPGLAAPADQVVPGPRAAEPGGRQHLIGDLSPEDCDAHLARRLVAGGQPLIGADIRDVITARSHGLPLHLDLAVSRFLEIRRTGQIPVAADFDCTFPALLARTLSDLTGEERHVLRSASLLDAFDLDLATRAAGLTHQAPARRLVDRPLVTEDPYALWPYHLHAAIRSAVRSDDHSEDRWTDTDWHQAATRALAALGDQWANTTDLAPSRRLLVACLRQGLRLARDHRLNDLGWLTDAAFTYTDDSIWEPLAPPTSTAPDGRDPRPGLATSADALAELLSAIVRRQHEHRQRTVDRLTAVLDTNLLPAELTEMAVYYRAKAHKDLGSNAASRAGMQHVADAGGRLAPKARRGLANLARIAGDFPTALAAVPTLGWKGRHHKVLGDIHWPHGDIDQAITAFEAARAEAEQHDAPGERAIAQVRLALVVAFADPVRADDELAFAYQLLDHLDQRATTLLAHTAALIKDAGTDRNVTGRAQALHTEVTDAGLPWLIRFLQIALAFHHAIQGAHQDLAATIDRLHELTAATGDFAYFTDIAHFMGNLPHPSHSTVRWLDGHGPVRERWHALVTARARQLGTSQ
ncbi:ATP/GTP-binding protein [Streptantibioticus ferralitis]|uniref:ATP/GTP-binding protein n=1 Tax=Streptantibioticus ferralitis TaxID=236510 RepID=A0ABT5Z7Y8_9ACTN|nr:ATP/GTP-binding protein [Streptantibioticus ferralitis]MDF2259757.1 ATP/GTP-binding protein [Streptantibioticus ferralitis]